MIYSYAVNPTAGSQFELGFDKPAVAAIVDVVHEMAGGQAFTSRALVDRPLRDGARKLSGILGAVSGQVTAARFRTWYVEYQDGTTEGALDAGKAREEVVPYRRVVKAYAVRYAQRAREGLDAVRDELAKDEAWARAQRERGDEVSAEESVALGMMRSSLDALPNADQLADHFERMAAQ